MIETIKKLLVKYRELIVYVIVGGITTVINWGVSQGAGKRGVARVIRPAPEHHYQCNCMVCGSCCIIPHEQKMGIPE